MGAEPLLLAAVAVVLLADCLLVLLPGRSVDVAAFAPAVAASMAMVFLGVALRA